MRPRAALILAVVALIAVAAGGPASAAATTVLVRGGHAAITVSCPTGAQEPCTGTVTMTISAPRALTLGRTGFSASPGQSTRVSVPISSAGLKLLAHGRRLRALVRIEDNGTTSDTTGQTVVSDRTITLRRAPAPRREEKRAVARLGTVRPIHQEAST